MLIVRLKQAETAMAAGRLDEAFGLVTQPDVRSHRRGQALVDRLTKLLIKRGRQHLDADRLDQCHADCEKAQRLSGSIDAVQALRKAVDDAMLSARQAERSHEYHLREAQQAVRAGRFSEGGQLLDGLERSSLRADQLRRTIEHQQEAKARIAANFERAMSEDDLTQALAALAQSRGAAVSDDERSAMRQRVAQRAVAKLGECIRLGRIDQAMAILQRCGDLDRDHLELRETKRIVEQCQQAAGWVEQGRFREAERVLRRLRTLAPEAKWIDAVLQQVKRAGEALEDLHAGPLGLTGIESGWGPGKTDGRRGQAAETKHVVPNAGDHNEASPPRPPVAPKTRYQWDADINDEDSLVIDDDGAALPDRLLLRVDGVGSFLIVRKPSVTIGPVSSSKRPDIGVMASPNQPVATLVRSDEDYFINGPGVMVNDRSAQGTLLAHGDRLALSPRCRVRFLRPNPASTSALIELDGARMPRADVRHVILMDQSIVIGPGAAAHVRCDAMDKPVVLQVRGHELTCAAEGGVTSKGRPIDRNEAIALNQPIEAGALSMVITRA